MVIATDRLNPSKARRGGSQEVIKEMSRSQRVMMVQTGAGSFFSSAKTPSGFAEVKNQLCRSKRNLAEMFKEKQSKKKKTNKQKTVVQKHRKKDTRWSGNVETSLPVCRLHVVVLSVPMLRKYISASDLNCSGHNHVDSLLANEKHKKGWLVT